MPRSLLLHVVLFLTAAACAAPKPPAADTTPPAPDPEMARLPLAERLAREARCRPEGTPRAEAVMTALRRGGLEVSAPRQVLATPVGARYCALSRTRSGLGVSVCEFPDEASAARGRAFSLVTFDRLIPHRSLHTNRKTLLTLTRPGPSLAADEARKAAALFASL